MQNDINSIHASFWMDANVLDGDITRLYMYKKSISNFVRILTNKNIPVRFNTHDESYTDGKSVVIAADTSVNKFDSSVGLALHEASHCILSDFKLLQNIRQISLLPDSIDISKWADFFHFENFGKDVTKNNIHRRAFMKKFENDIIGILNYIEDRRIDNHIYSTAPGYRPYYDKMYERYWNSDIIGKGLRSKEYRTEDINSYMFRIINLTNKNTDLNALHGLREIYDIIDIHNIHRLKSTKDAYEVTGLIMNVLAKYLERPESQDKSNQSSDTNNTSNQSNSKDNKTSSDGTGGENKSKKSENGDSDGSDKNDGSKKGDLNEDDTIDGNSDKTSDSDKTDTEENESSDGIPFKSEGENIKINKDKLDKDFKKQIQFILGDIRKTKTNKSTNSIIESLSKGDSDIVTINDNELGIPNVDTIIIRNLNKEMVENNSINSDTIIPIISRHGRDVRQAVINEGIRMGKRLGNMLTTRNESRELCTPRLKRGKLSNRLIHEISMNNFDIFERIDITESESAFIHISVDASGSMRGDKFNNTQSAVVAIAYACSMISNIDVVISYRTSILKSPALLIAYDSRKDNISKIKNLFSAIVVNGSTPEGLCFQSIMKEILRDCNGKDSYFINFSDGMPQFIGKNINDSKPISYTADTAVNHTAKQIDVMRRNDIKVLSYFINSNHVFSYTKTESVFKKMYGKEAEFINISNIKHIANTLNNKFKYDVR